jgi:hypothetical protein
MARGDHETPERVRRGLGEDGRVERHRCCIATQEEPEEGRAVPTGAADAATASSVCSGAYR